MKDKTTLTTKQAGDICGVDLTTVINWIGNGKIKAYRTVGGHRRIRQKDLMDFMREYSMPVPPELKEMSKDEVFKILIVENDVNIILRISNSLKQLRQVYEIATAADSFEAGIKLVTFKPNLVVLDMRLPGIDGYNVIRKIRERDEYIEILVITVTEHDEIKEKIIQAGANGYLKEYFSGDEFLHAIDEVVKYFG